MDDVRARVSHQPDRSYLVLIDGPGGVLEAGRTFETREVLRLARLFGGDVAVDFPQPPYGRDGQWVRIRAVDDPSEADDVGRLAQAFWFSAESAWFVTVAGSGTGIKPSEHLDFAPTVTAEEVAAHHAYLAANAQR